MKRKKRRRNRKPCYRKPREPRVITRGYHSNVHHLLFQRRHWDSGYGKLLRNVFTFKVDEWTHNLLHHTVIQDVPRPPEKLLKAAWEDYTNEKETVDNMNILQALSWLMTHIEDDDCRKALATQYCFFAQNGGW